ncbi:MAG: DUF924 domain-containing protein [Myxococcales bacterium]|nr:DUF924 domain-containing protein [Myxococcales bacterium]
MLPDEVLEFWFGTPDPAGDVPDAVFAKYWKKDESFDALIRDRFGDAHSRASRGELSSLADTPRGRLALVILLDQFTRNLFRGQAATFAQDAQALRLALDGIDAGDLERLMPLQRYFLIMPLMHSEQLEDQERCIELFDAQVAASDDAGVKKRFVAAADFARRHRDIVRRFGRFPHRNAVLGRESTPDEQEFLKTPGSSF